MDVLSKDQRHKNMAAIHSANTKPEMIVRKYLFTHGFRYRLNHPRLPGVRTLYYENTVPAFLLMAVSGMVMRVANIMLYQKRIQSSGQTRSTVTSHATRRSKKNWLKWDGIVSQYGNVN